MTSTDLPFEDELTELGGDAPPRKGSQSVQGPEDIEKEASFSEQAESEEKAASGSDAARIAELEEKLLLSLAEFENYRKRSGRLQDDQIRSSVDRVFQQLFEIQDNLERALAAVPEDHREEPLAAGVAMIHAQMLELLRRNNIHPIEAVGQPFDSSRHEALLQVASDQHPEGVIVQEITRGYMRDERVIRHSRVGVSSGRAAENV